MVGVSTTGFGSGSGGISGDDNGRPRLRGAIHVMRRTNENVALEDRIEELDDQGLL
ncbi:hypothetical protein [Actinomadura sp. CNU-125]|uniref:hypothetical protein n=1 Tax=Actinomadura sp. CNU-125 TaxID=1904961 RepID=UPI00130115A6|nr:hypothetical protein [Actinomadura sp. CNU-125]